MIFKYRNLLRTQTLMIKKNLTHTSSTQVPNDQGCQNGDPM